MDVMGMVLDSVLQRSFPQLKDAAHLMLIVTDAGRRPALALQLGRGASVKRTGSGLGLVEGLSQQEVLGAKLVAVVAGTILHFTDPRRRHDVGSVVDAFCRDLSLPQELRLDLIEALPEAFKQFLPTRGRFGRLVAEYQVCVRGDWRWFSAGEIKAIRQDLVQSRDEFYVFVDDERDECWLKDPETGKTYRLKNDYTRLSLIMTLAEFSGCDEGERVCDYFTLYSTVYGITDAPPRSQQRSRLKGDIHKLSKETGGAFKKFVTAVPGQGYRPTEFLRHSAIILKTVG